MTVMFSSQNLTKIYFNYRKGKFSPHLKCRAYWSQRLSVSLWICWHCNSYEIVCFFFMCTQPACDASEEVIFAFCYKVNISTICQPETFGFNRLLTKGLNSFVTVIKLNWNSKLANVYLGEIIVEFYNQPFNIRFNECEDNSTLPICLLHFDCFIKLWSVVFVLINLFSLSCFQIRFPGVPSEIQEENGIKFKYQVFKRDTADTV